MSYAAVVSELLLLKSIAGRWGIICLGIFWASRVWCQPYIEPSTGDVDLVDPAMRVRKTSRPVPELGWGVDASGLTGFGVFRDIQVPINRDYEMRADGRKIGEENADHLAYILGATLSPIWRGRNWRLQPVDLGMMRMTPIAGPFDSLNSAYTRFDARSQIAWSTTVGRQSWTVDGTIGWRRSEFNNGSDSHFVTSLPVGLGAKVALPTWSFRAYGHTALSSQFGYSQALLFGGSEIQGSKSELADGGITGEFRISPSAWLIVGAEIEAIRVQITDVKAYEAFGLTVQDPKRTRDYMQTTSSLSLGVRKLF